MQGQIIAHKLLPRLESGVRPCRVTVEFPEFVGEKLFKNKFEFCVDETKRGEFPIGCGMKTVSTVQQALSLTEQPRRAKSEPAA